MTILIQDNYTRSDTAGNQTPSDVAGWGTSSDGNVYTQWGTTGPTYAILGNQGEFTNTSADNWTTLSPTTYTDADATIRVTVNAAGGSVNNWEGLTLRFTSATQNYVAYLKFGGASGVLSIVRYNGGSSTLASTAMTVNTSTEYKIRFRIIGTALSAKAWVDGSTEPDWMVTATDTTFSSGLVGLYESPNSVSATMLFDSFIVTDGTSTVTAVKVAGNHKAFGRSL